MGDLFYDGYISKFCGNFLELPHCNLRISDLTSPESNANLDFVAILKPTARVSDLELRVVLVGLGAQLNFFDFDLFLSFTSLTFLFCLFVKELSKIHNPDDRRIGVGRDFD